MASAGTIFGIVSGSGLLVTTVLGAWATVYADLFPDSSLGQQKVALAVGWLGCVVLSLLVLGYQDRSSSGGPLARIQWGVRLLRENAGYAFLVLFMTCAAAFCVYGKLIASSEQSGVLKRLVATADRMDRVAQETKNLAQRAAMSAESTGRKADTIIEQSARIENKLNRPLGPREQLAAQGISWDGPSFSQALVGGDSNVVELFLKGGFNARTATAPQGEGGNALGYFVGLAPVTDMAATVKILRLLAEKMDVTEPVAIFRGIPAMNLLTVALYTCNLPVAQALVAAGVNTRKLTRATGEGHLGPLDYDAVGRLVKWKPTHAIDDRACSESDRQKLLKIATGGATP